MCGIRKVEAEFLSTINKLTEKSHATEDYITKGKMLYYELTLYPQIQTAS